MRGTVRALSELKNKVIKEGKENCSGGGAGHPFIIATFTVPADLENASGDTT